MAANFWESNSAKTFVSKHRLLNSQLEDRVRGLTEENLQQIKIHFINSISELVKYCKLRQRVAATASIYFRRFYLRNCFCFVDPRLVYVGCVFLASKAEESLVNARHLVAFIKKLRPSWPYDVKHLLDIEMVIMEDLDFTLIVYSPYRPLKLFLHDAGLAQPLGQRSWAVLNDSYRTSVSLMHPPHLVALACIIVAAGMLRREAAASVEAEAPAAMQAELPPGPAQQTLAAVDQLNGWLEGLDVDLDKVYEISTELITMYEERRNTLTADECNKLLDAVQVNTGGSGAGMTGPATASAYSQLVTGGMGGGTAPMAAFRR